MIKIVLVLERVQDQDTCNLQPGKYKTRINTIRSSLDQRRILSLVENFFLMRKILKYFAFAILCEVSCMISKV